MSKLDDLRRQCGLNVTEGNLDFDSAHGRAACSRCGRYYGRRRTKDYQPYQCHASCPAKKFYCSKKCEDLDGHQCLNYQHVPRQNTRCGAPELQLQFAKETIEAGGVIADVKIHLRLPRVFYYIMDDSKRAQGLLIQLGIPCIECGLWEDEFIDNVWITVNTRRTDITIIRVTNYDPYYSLIMDEPIAINSKVKSRCCKKCEWPLCDECRKGKVHSDGDCSYLARVNKMRKRKGLLHPLLKNPDFGIFFIGLMRVYQLKKWKPEEYSEFHTLSIGRDMLTYLPGPDLAYLELFLTEFAPYLEFFELTNNELKEIASTLMYFRVDSHAVSQLPVTSVNGSGGVVDSRANKREYLVLGIKVQFGCSPNAMLIKSVNEGHVLLKACNALKKGEFICLDLFDRREKNKLSDIFQISFFGYGEDIFERGRRHRQCTISSCDICRLSQGRFSQQMTAFLTIPQQLCPNCRCMTTYRPEYVRRDENLQDLIWRCANCKASQNALQRTEEFSRNISVFSAIMCATRGGNAASGDFKSLFDKIGSKSLCPAEQLCALADILRLTGEHLRKMISVPDVQLPSFMTRENVLLLCDMFFKVLEPYKSFAFRIEAGRVKMVRVMSWLLLVGQENLVAVEDFDRKRKELVEAISQMNTSAADYDHGIYDSLLRLALQKEGEIMTLRVGVQALGQ